MQVEHETVDENCGNTSSYAEEMGISLQRQYSRLVEWTRDSDETLYDILDFRKIKQTWI